MKNYNTFGFDVMAKWLCIIESVEDLRLLLETPTYKQHKVLFIGGGSNILLQADFEGLVVVNRIKGIEFTEIEGKQQVYVKAGGGEKWHDLVLKSIEAGLGGLENLSLIPGTVGAAPMQNIGAYGVEIKDVFHSLEALNLQTGIIEGFNKEQCAFGYRESVFKHQLKGLYLIVSVNFLLEKEEHHELSVHYGAIKELLEKRKLSKPSIKDVSDVVIEIRQSKLPDPKVIGNSGSFFKNPVVQKSVYEALKVTYPDIPGYVVSEQEVKLAAGWLIEHLGWKGFTENGVGVHDRQALVLVNKGNGSGAAIASLAKKIQESVWNTFKVELSPEVNFVP